MQFLHCAAGYQVHKHGKACLILSLILCIFTEQTLCKVPDLYQTLGVSRDASEMCIRRAFREKAKKVHPDLNPGAHSGAFHSLNEAYQVLSNPQLRHLYDLRLKHGTYVSYRVHYRPGNVANAHHAYAQKRKESYSRELKMVVKVLNHFLFLSLLFLGLFTLGFGIYMLFQEPVEGVNPMLGVIFGAVFSLLLAYGYRHHTSS